MLTLLKIKNVALIDDLTIEFGGGLNLLTGETGSGKSIIVDSLGALTGERVTSDIVKQDKDSARIEGIFSVVATSAFAALMNDSGIEVENTSEPEVIIRRDISLAGKNRVFVNNQLVTQGFLKSLGLLLADIHGNVAGRRSRHTRISENEIIQTARAIFHQGRVRGHILCFFSTGGESFQRRHISDEIQFDEEHLVLALQRAGLD